MKKLTSFIGAGLLALLQMNCAGMTHSHATGINPQPIPEIPAKKSYSAPEAAKSKEWLEIERLSILLDSADWNIREDAMKEISLVCENIGKESLNIIRAEINGAVSLEVKERLEAVYTDLEYSFENIVQNSSFEKGLECWESTNTGGIRVVQEEKISAPDGFCFIEMQDNTCTQDIRDVIRHGVPYYFAFWYCTAEQSSSFALGLSDGSIVSALVSVPSYSQRLETDGEWHKIACMYTYNTEEQAKQWPYLVISVGGKGCIDNVVIKAVPEEFCPGICRNRTFEEFIIYFDMGDAEGESSIVIMSRCIRCGFQERTKTEDIFSVCHKCAAEFNLCPICGKLRGYEIK